MLIFIFHMKINGKIAYGGRSYVEKMRTLPYFFFFFFSRISQICRLDEVPEARAKSLAKCRQFVSELLASQLYSCFSN